LLVFSLGFVLGFTLALWVGFSPARTNLVLGLGTDICLFVYTVAIRLLAIAGYWVELIWAFFYNIYWLISDLVLFSARCAGRLVGLYEFTGQETYW